MTINTHGRPPGGIERRRSQRRGIADRREEFRFEPGKDGRRQQGDRRKPVGWDGTLLR